MQRHASHARRELHYRPVDVAYEKQQEPAEPQEGPHLLEPMPSLLQGEPVNGPKPKHALEPAYLELLR